MSSLEAVTSLNTTSQTSADDARTKFSADFDNFLLILTTQLQNQDPLSPTDTHEFTNQLVLFADVEQSIQQNSNLEKLIDLQSSNQAIGALGYIGQEAELEGDMFTLDENDTDGTTLYYDLLDDANNASITVFDAAGEAVLVQSVDTDFGKHSFTFDGKDSSGVALPSGIYSFRVNAVDTNDVPVEVTHSFDATIDGVESGDDGSVFLSLGQGVSIAVEKVLRVFQTAGQSVTQG